MKWSLVKIARNGRFFCQGTSVSQEGCLEEKKDTFRTVDGVCWRHYVCSIESCGILCSFESAGDRSNICPLSKGVSPLGLI